MHVRVSRFTGGSPDHLDEAAARVREDLLPRMRDMKGFMGVIACGDRQSGEQMALTFWADADAMRESEEAASQMRGEDLDEDEQIAGVERYEVLLTDWVDR